MMEKMIKNLQKKSNKKGFTLVEIIVVLVILAILAAIAIPSVMGYVNDAKESKYIQEARSIYLVVQTEEARWRAENNKKSTDAVDASVYTNPQGGIVKQKTDLTDVTITPPSGSTKYYTFTWTSDGSSITAHLTTNKDVKIIK